MMGLTNAMKAYARGFLRGIGFSFDESKVKRDNDGKFSSTGGGGKGKKEKAPKEKKSAKSIVKARRSRSLPSDALSGPPHKTSMESVVSVDDFEGDFDLVAEADETAMEDMRDTIEMSLEAKYGKAGAKEAMKQVEISPGEFQEFDSSNPTHASGYFSHDIKAPKKVLEAVWEHVFGEKAPEDAIEKA
jgi:hypothetical protein